jgi:hypothetical protein
MAEVDFDAVVEQAYNLPREQQLRLHDLLWVWLSRPPGRKEPLTEEELDEELLIQGVLDHVPPPRKGRPPWKERPPVKVKGKPVSETIIEERR